MAKKLPHPLWDIEHELNNVRRILDIWHEDTPAAVRKGVRTRISTMENLVRSIRHSAAELLGAVIYPTQIPGSAKSHGDKSEQVRRKHQK